MYLSKQLWGIEGWFEHFEKLKSILPLLLVFITYCDGLIVRCASNQDIAKSR
jgi:hypothetical protein